SPWAASRRISGTMTWAWTSTTMASRIGDQEQRAGDDERRPGPDPSGDNLDVTPGEERRDHQHDRDRCQVQREDDGDVGVVERHPAAPGGEGDDHAGEELGGERATRLLGEA